MAEAPNLVESRVRIVLLRQFREMPIDIFRGIVTDSNAAGITISGRHFQEVRDSVAGQYEERPLSLRTKVYFIPYSTIKYVDVILPGSREEEIGNRVEGNEVLEKPIKEYTFSAISGRKAR